MDHYAHAEALLGELHNDPDGPDAHVRAYMALAHATLAAAGPRRPRRVVATPVPAKRKASK